VVSSRLRADCEPLLGGATAVISHAWLSLGELPREDAAGLSTPRDEACRREPLLAKRFPLPYPVWIHPLHKQRMGSTASATRQPSSRRSPAMAYPSRCIRHAVLWLLSRSRTGAAVPGKLRSALPTGAPCGVCRGWLEQLPGTGCVTALPQGLAWRDARDGKVTRVAQPAAAGPMQLPS